MTVVYPTFKQLSFIVNDGRYSHHVIINDSDYLHNLIVNDCDKVRVATIIYVIVITIICNTFRSLLYLKHRVKMLE